MKRAIVIILLTAALGAGALSVSAQNVQSYALKTRITDTRGVALNGAMVESQNAVSSAVSDTLGNVELQLNSGEALLKISMDGYFPVEKRVSVGSAPSAIVMIPRSWVNYSEESSLNKKDMQQAMSIDVALEGRVAGLQVVQKGGMPGEGAYLNVGGIHSIEAENTPLIVLNGVPYLHGSEVSTAINGYSRSLFAALNINDIRNITLLTGADAAAYGSLGSNGVISIETEMANSKTLDTRISLAGQYGMHFKGRTVDVLGASDYKNYLRDVGMTRYSQMGQLTADYPFLQSSEEYNTSHIFSYNTDWQKEIYNNAFLTNNVFRVEGGDEIAKYNISVGYSSDGGTVVGTRSQRYHTLINTDINVARTVGIFSSIGLSYIRSNLHEQGMSQETNPLLASWYNMPVLGPYYSTNEGITSTYATYDFSNVNANPQYPYENVSNPTALVRTLDAGDKMYDVNILLGLDWDITDYLKAVFTYNRQYRYLEEQLFIPGMTNQAIYPQYYGIGRNTVRKAVSEDRNNYYSINLNFNKSFNSDHSLAATLGGRIMTTSSEYDMSSGYNTANDFYKTLDKTTDEEHTTGYNNLWKWANYYLTASYTWHQMIRANVNMVLDGSSVSGKGAPLYYLYPSAKLTFMGTGISTLPQWINRLDVSAEFAMSGNSRFSSNYGKYFYTSSNFFSMGSIIRSDIPNTLLEPEKQRQVKVGADLSFLRNRVQLGAFLTGTHSYDLLVQQSISSVYASEYYFENKAVIDSKGYAVNVRFTPVENKKFSWVLGGNISGDRATVKNLGEQDCLDIAYTALRAGEDAIVRLQKGETPYQFYGYQTNGIYSTTAEARSANLTTPYGGKYQAGDVRFVDRNGDGVINEEDKVLLGTTRPDFYGGFFTTLRYRQFSLTANFNYNVGGKIYNAARRNLESMSTFYNQSTAVLNRWQVEGQQTGMPRASYGDPNGNNLFSDRWIEDGSYLKLGTVTLSYSIERPVFIFRSGTVWISADNLLTFTNYLGNDPETAYSYDNAMYGIDYVKAPNAKSVKIGFNLNF